MHRFQHDCQELLWEALRSELHPPIPLLHSSPLVERQSRWAGIWMLSCYYPSCIILAIISFKNSLEKNINIKIAACTVVMLLQVKTISFQICHSFPRTRCNSWTSATAMITLMLTKRIGPRVVICTYCSWHTFGQIFEHISILFSVCFNQDINLIATQGSDDLERFLKLRADELADNGFGLYLMLGANKGQSKSNHIRR